MRRGDRTRRSATGWRVTNVNGDGTIPVTMRDSPNGAASIGLSLALVLALGGCAGGMSKNGNTARSDAGDGVDARDANIVGSANDGGGGDAFVTSAADGGPSDSGAASTVGQYDPFELSLTYPTAGLTNPWEDVTVTASVTTPSGKTLSFDGFYYDVDTYKVRFAPVELGNYRYTVKIAGPSSAPDTSGSFRSIASQNKGFLRKHPSNPYRLIFEKGAIANAIGINDCWNRNTAKPLAGTIEEGQVVDVDTYMKTYGDGGAGFNVLRWNPANCSFDIVGSIAASGNTYLVPEGKRGDTLLAAAHAHGLHVIFAFFHLQEWMSAMLDPNRDAALKKAIRYAMARYGAYTDVWELTNESDATTIPDAWVQRFADYVRAQDPYARMVTNSWQRASDWSFLDARSPHINIYNDALVDEKRFTNDFSTNAPVIVGEMYNNGSSNWDANSARNLRRYAWSAFMSGLVDVYWNSTYQKGTTNGGPTPNMYIGAEERGYIAQLQQVSASVDPDVVQATVGVTVASLTAHGLRSPKMLLVYAYRAMGSGVVAMSVDVPIAGTAMWIDPPTGKVLAQASVESGMQTLTSPSCSDDIALTVK